MVDVAIFFFLSLKKKINKIKKGSTHHPKYSKTHDDEYDADVVSYVIDETRRVFIVLVIYPYAVRILEWNIIIFLKVCMWAGGKKK